MNTIEIRKASPTDILQLGLISRQTFSDTFAEENSNENMNKYLEEHLTDERLMEEISDVNASFYFATDGDNVIGYMKLNTGIAQTELKDQHTLEIERIYVLKQYLGKKAGQALFNKALQVAGEKKFTYIWLGVWEKNARAIKFYHKNGFTAFDKHIFKLGDDKQTDIMMKLML